MGRVDDGWGDFAGLSWDSLPRQIHDANLDLLYFPAPGNPSIKHATKTALYLKKHGLGMTLTLSTEQFVDAVDVCCMCFCGIMPKLFECLMRLGHLACVKLRVFLAL